jgi:hypothetical protein
MCRYRTESSTKRDRARVAIPLRGFAAKNFRRMVNAATKSCATPSGRGGVTPSVKDGLSERETHPFSPITMGCAALRTTVVARKERYHLMPRRKVQYKLKRSCRASGDFAG